MGKAVMTGLDEDTVVEVTETEEKPKRKPFHYWKVDGKEYKCKLNSDATMKLEKQFGGSLFAMLDQMPSLSNMITIMQAAIAPWHHGTTTEKVKLLYDQWIEEGGSQTDFFKAVVIPTMVASGFFPVEMGDKFLRDLSEE